MLFICSKLYGFFLAYSDVNIRRLCYERRSLISKV